MHFAHMASFAGFWKYVLLQRDKVQGLGPSREGALRTWRGVGQRPTAYFNLLNQGENQ